MILAQITQDTVEKIGTPGSILMGILYFVLKHFLVDTKKSKRDEKSDDVQTALLTKISQGIESQATNLREQIRVAEARREGDTKLIEMRHAENLHRMGEICKYNNKQE